MPSQRPRWMSKNPEPRQKLPPEVVQRVFDSLWNPPPKPASDYERSIDKSYSEEMEERKSGKKVSQLGEQDVQLVRPLKVFADKDVQNDSTGLNVPQQRIGDAG